MAAAVPPPPSAAPGALPLCPAVTRHRAEGWACSTHNGPEVPGEMGQAAWAPHTHADTHTRGCTHRHPPTRAHAQTHTHTDTPAPSQLLRGPSSTFKTKLISAVAGAINRFSSQGRVPGSRVPGSRQEPCVLPHPGGCHPRDGGDLRPRAGVPARGPRAGGGAELGWSWGAGAPDEGAARLPEEPPPSLLSWRCPPGPPQGQPPGARVRLGLAFLPSAPLGDGGRRGWEQGHPGHRGCDSEGKASPQAVPRPG